MRSNVKNKLDPSMIVFVFISDILVSPRDCPELSKDSNDILLLTFLISEYVSVTGSITFTEDVVISAKLSLSSFTTRPFVVGSDDILVLLKKIVFPERYRSRHFLPVDPRSNCTSFAGII